MANNQPLPKSVWKKIFNCKQASQELFNTAKSIKKSCGGNSELINILTHNPKYQCRKVTREFIDRLSTLNKGIVTAGTVLGVLGKGVNVYAYCQDPLHMIGGGCLNPGSDDIYKTFHDAFECFKTAINYKNVEEEIALEWCEIRAIERLYSDGCIALHVRDHLKNKHKSTINNLDKQEAQLWNQWKYCISKRYPFGTECIIDEAINIMKKEPKTADHYCDLNGVPKGESPNSEKLPGESCNCSDYEASCDGLQCQNEDCDDIEVTVVNNPTIIECPCCQRCYECPYQCGWVYGAYNRESKWKMHPDSEYPWLRDGYGLYSGSTDIGKLSGSMVKVTFYLMLVVGAFRV